jgi:hypothetical protein
MVVEQCDVDRYLVSVTLFDVATELLYSVSVSGKKCSIVGREKKSNLKGSDARVDDRSLDEHGGRQPLLCQPHRLSAS